ncbi:ATP-dependent nuclease [Paenibacillus agaridevorans]|uniref:ATP-dependent nuclease n=1 Tax=Paenibacillus agaridevorans TaxID=171404 RepID=UPI001BE3D518|nr:AAA family ATPase [Paenibacillus agaridevorans]
MSSFGIKWRGIRFKIRYIRIQNFRGISEFSACMSKDLISIVGQNDVGKSTVLRALCTFFEKEKVGKEDFQKGNEHLPIEIEVHFECVGLEQLKHNGLIKLKQVYSKVMEKINSQKLFFYEAEKAKDEELQKYAVLKQWAKKCDVETPAIKPSEDAIQEIRNKVISKLQLLPNEDWKHADWDELSKHLPEIIFIPASQDYENEQKMSNDSSVFGKLFRVGIRNWLSTDPESKIALQTIKTKVETINNQFIRIVEQKLREQLTLAEGLSQELDPLDVSRGFSFTMQVEDSHGIRTPLSQRGSGLQRAVLVAVIRAQSEINETVARMKDANGGELQGKDQTKSGERSVFYIFEEPEAFLHLSAQKDLFYSLRDLSKQNNQVILTTHSTLFIDESDMDDVVLLVREQGKTISRQHIPQEEIRDQLGERIRLSELLTGKVCCLVEGLSDKYAFERWATRLGYDIKRQGIHFISMDGCKNMDYFANVSILHDFNVPFKIILDSDSHGETNTSERIKFIKQRLPKLKSDCFIMLGKGELENYYCVDTLAQELNIPRHHINDTQYAIDPKEQLKIATQRAIEAGSKKARKYKETEHSKVIAEKMPIELIDKEIVDIVNELKTMSQTINKALEEIKRGLAEAAASSM